MRRLFDSARAAGRIGRGALAAGLLLVQGADAPPGQAAALAGAAADAVCRPVVRVEAAAGGSFVVRGWAVDVLAPPEAGTGVEAVQIHLNDHPDSGGVDLGAATYGLARDDVAGLLGGQHLASGFELDTGGPLPPDARTVRVHVLTACGWQEAAVTAAPAPAAAPPPACRPLLSIDAPVNGAKIALGGELTVAGWAVDAGSAGPGVGVDSVVVRAGSDPGAGEVLGSAGPSMPRGDVAEGLGLRDERFRQIGFAIHIPASRLRPTADGAAPEVGPVALTVVAHTACGPVNRTLTVELAHPSGTIGSENDLLPPTNLRLVSFADGVASLAWDPSPSPRLTGYAVRMSKDGGEFRAVETLATDVLTLRVTGLSKDSRYEFQVSARRNDQTSRASNTVSNAAPTSPSLPLPGRSASATPAPAAHFYDLPGARGPAAAPAPGSAAGSTTPPPPAPGQTAPPAATPTASQWSSPASQWSAPPPASSATPSAQLGAPTISSVQQVFGLDPGLRAVRVAFSSVPGASGYVLYRSSGGGTWTEVADGGADATALLDGSIFAAGTYSYTVVARGAGGAVGPASGPQSVAVR